MQQMCEYFSFKIYCVRLILMYCISFYGSKIHIEIYKIIVINKVISKASLYGFHKPENVKR